MSLPQNKTEYFSFIAISCAIIFLFYMHLIWGFVAGISSFLLISKLKVFFDNKFSKHTANKLTLSVIALFVTIFLMVIILGSYKVYSVSLLNLSEFYSEILSVLQQLKTHIPEDYRSYIPEDIYSLKDFIAVKMHSNMPNVVIASQLFFKGFAHVIIGVIIGAIIALSPHDSSKETSLILFLKLRFHNFCHTFANVVSAQAKISLINTILTSIFLFTVPHIFSSSFPYYKTIICLTFILGMIPAIGNLISNALIFIIALTVSLNVAVCSLVYLIFIHKLEYYFNAKLIGSKLNTKIWELLIVMVIFESIFGITGLALSPIIYGYIKFELEKKNLI